jgi:hypothetical protein
VYGFLDLCPLIGEKRILSIFWTTFRTLMQWRCDWWLCGSRATMMQ